MSDIKLILLIVLISFICTKNIVIIGDSRTCSVGYNRIGFSYTYHDDNYLAGSYIIGNKAIKYGDHKIKLIAEIGASSDTFQQPDKEVAKAVKKILSFSSSGTIVLLWLGLNDPDYSNTFNYYKSLANQYQHLTFYAISVTGVGPYSPYFDNHKIKQFNQNLKDKIKTAGLSNLKYKSIVNNDDVTQIYNINSKDVTFTVTESTIDYYGIYYNRKGEREILLAMLANI